MYTNNNVINKNWEWKKEGRNVTASTFTVQKLVRYIEKLVWDEESNTDFFLG